jgi:predicted phage-related endonuclease
MPRTLEQLRKAADLFREKAGSCSTSEAKSALLEIGRDLDEEAAQLSETMAGKPATVSGEPTV